MKEIYKIIFCRIRIMYSFVMKNVHHSCVYAEDGPSKMRIIQCHAILHDVIGVFSSAAFSNCSLKVKQKV